VSLEKVNAHAQLIAAVGDRVAFYLVLLCSEMVLQVLNATA
jgi:hypothetical protein